MCSDFDDWWTPLKEFAKKEKNFANWKDFANEEDFNKLLSDFLFSSEGASYKNNFKFAEELICGKPAPRILVILLLLFHTNIFSRFRNSLSNTVICTMRINIS